MDHGQWWRLGCLSRVGISKGICVDVPGLQELELVDWIKVVCGTAGNIRTGTELKHEILYCQKASACHCRRHVYKVLFEFDSKIFYFYLTTKQTRQLISAAVATCW